MSPPLLGVEGAGHVNSSSASIDSLTQMGLKERNYLGLSDCSSVGSSTVPSLSDENSNKLNLKATELRLGLPGSQSPERDPTNFNSEKLDEKPLFPLLPLKDSICSSTQKNVVSGSKRGFADTVEIKGSLFSEGNWMFSAADSEATKGSGQGKASVNAAKNVMSSSGFGGTQSAVTKDVPSKASQANGAAGHNNKLNGSDNTGSAPVAKAQVVGWPPIRSFRKNTLAMKNNEEVVDGKPGPAGAALFVKVSMEGAPYLRKVDLRSYSTYQQLSEALEKMFTCFTIGQCGSQLCESKLRDLLHGSEYVLTYEDKDGDWMLVGDVPWEMFIGSCKRLKIMKGSDAIGLAPRAMEKSRSRN